MKAFANSELKKLIVEIGISAGLSLIVILPVFLFELLSSVLV